LLESAALKPQTIAVVAARKNAIVNMILKLLSLAHALSMKVYSTMATTANMTPNTPHLMVVFITLSFIGYLRIAAFMNTHFFAFVATLSGQRLFAGNAVHRSIL
jgi:hypothetical protein